MSEKEKNLIRKTDRSNGLRASGWLAEHPAVGVVAFLAGMLIFGILSYALVTKSPMVKWDIQMADRLHSIAVQTPPSINEIMTFGFFMGKEDLQLLGAILMVYFLYKRFWAELAMVVFGWGGGSVLWSLLSGYFNRTRPEAQVGIEVRIAGYPSGHSIFAVLALGLLAYLLVPKMPSTFWKWTIALVHILFILFIGFSRAFQGNHYILDILAGYALGIAWGALVYTVLEIFAFKRKT